MSEDIERELRGLDADRPLPPELYSRLEAALLGDDAAELLDALDAPRPIPPTTRAALEQELTGGPRRRDPRFALLAAAAVVLLVLGSVAVLKTGGSSSRGQVAVGPARSVPAAGVPPVLQAPTTAPLAAAAVEPASPPTTRRSTTTTTWNCGLCARNGYAGSYAAAAAAAPPAPAVATSQPSDGSQVQAAALAPGVYSVDPDSGPKRGGRIVTLRGAGLTGASGVRFGSTSAVNFTVVSDSEIRVMTPTSPVAQKVSVSVTYADGTATPTSDSGPFFTYT
jgi:hypothetical protein